MFGPSGNKAIMKPNPFMQEESNCVYNLLSDSCIIGAQSLSGSNTCFLKSF